MASGEYISSWNVNGTIHEIHDAGRAQPNGVATLGENGLVPEEQLPSDIVRSINNMSPTSGNIDLDSLPINKTSYSWTHVMMFSYMYGKHWDAVDNILAKCYYKGYLYVLRQSGTEYTIEKCDAEDCDFGNASKAVITLSFASLTINLSIPPLLIVKEYNDTAKIFIICNNNSNVCGIYGYIESNGAQFLSVSKSNSKFSYLEYYQDGNKECLLYTISATNTTTKTSCAGRIPSTNFDPIELDLQYTGEICSSDLYNDYVFLSVGDDSGRALHRLDIRHTDVSAPTDTNLDSGGTYNVKALKALTYDKVVIYDTISGKILIIRASSSSVTELGTGIANCFIVLGETEILALNTLADSKLYINLDGTSLWNSRDLSVDTQGISPSGFYVLKAEYANGRHVLATFSSTTNKLIVLSSLDGIHFTQDYIASISITLVGSNIRIQNIAFCWNIFCRDALNLMDLVSGLESSISEKLIPSLRFNYISYS